MFCSGCGNALQSVFKFCPECSNPVPQIASPLDDGHFSGATAHCSNRTPTNSTPISTPSFKQFLASKSMERNNNRGISFRLKKKKLMGETEVTINIGMMKQTNKGNKEVLRGKSLPLRLKQSSKAANILNYAVEKRKHYDCSFRKDLQYTLVYPDGSVVENIPGTQEEFTLARYKEELGKPFSRINLFLLFEDAFDSDEKDYCTNDSFRSNTEGASNQSERVASEATDTVTKVRCPICNLMFPMKEIEVHADLCLSIKKYPFCAYDDDQLANSNDDIPELVHKPKHVITTNSSGKSNAIEIALEIKEILQAIPEREDTEVTVNIRRAYAFKDFHAFFSKPWNKAKMNCKYKFTFIGESGVDTGGVARDFFSCK